VATTQHDEQQPQEAGRVLDARGRRVSQLDPVAMHLLRRPGIIPTDVLREIAEQVGIGLTRGTRLVFWTSILGLLCFAIALIICLSRLADGRITTGIFFRNMIVYFAVFSGVASSWISLRSARHRKTTGAMLRHLRCPHCGYDLRMLPADPADGATVCPECGCAWKLDPPRGNAVR
jgi:hypothetical protein